MPSSGTPSTAAAISSERATEILQPVTEAVRTNTEIAFITIMSTDGTRFTHVEHGVFFDRFWADGPNRE